MITIDDDEIQRLSGLTDQDLLVELGEAIARQEGEIPVMAPGARRLERMAEKASA